jgi:N-acetylated-alpha-linked acidic dipeptidase
MPSPSWIKALQGLRQGVSAPCERRRRRGRPARSGSASNAALANLELTLTDPRGLPGGREWYQHMIYAPGAHTGYGVKTLPGIREAIEDRRWDEANEHMGVVARALNAYSSGWTARLRLLESDAGFGAVPHCGPSRVSCVRTTVSKPGEQ